MSKILTNTGYDLDVLSNAGNHKFCIHREMIKSGGVFDKNGKCIGGAPWVMRGWYGYLYKFVNGQWRRVSWTGRDGCKYNRKKYETKRDAIMSLEHVFNGIFKEASDELFASKKK